jgi:hypothetical protein
MNHYAGLDVSLEETAICVVDGTGRGGSCTRRGQRASLRRWSLP